MSKSCSTDAAGTGHEGRGGVYPARVSRAVLDAHLPWNSECTLISNHPMMPFAASVRIPSAPIPRLSEHRSSVPRPGGARQNGGRRASPIIWARCRECRYRSPSVFGYAGSCPWRDSADPPRCPFAVYIFRRGHACGVQNIQRGFGAVICPPSSILRRPVPAPGAHALHSRPTRGSAARSCLPMISMSLLKMLSPLPASTRMPSEHR